MAIFYIDSGSFNNLQVTGSLLVTGEIFGTSSLATTSSHALTASFITASNVRGTVLSSSYSLTASYVNPLNQILFITGGINLLNQTSTPSLTITLGSTKVFTITGSGVTVFGTLNNPQVETGGIYFDGTDFFLGFN